MTAEQSWQKRYQTALRRMNIAFAVAAFLFPLILLLLIYLLEASGICWQPVDPDLPERCTVLGYDFSSWLDLLIRPGTMGIATLTCFVMSGTGTMLYLLWRAKEK